MLNKDNLINDLKRLSDKKQATLLQRFFKTGKGEYGEGDIFWGLKVPQTREAVSKYKELGFAEIEKLMRHKVHEVRLAALLILVERAKEYPERVYRLYLKNTKHINNWDLVDLSAPRIVGAYLEDKDKGILFTLARSKSLWERRIAILATFYSISKGCSDHALRIARVLLKDKEDLIHKAVGWMLREVGKRCSINSEEIFLRKYANIMPRTMLRYAIEKFPESKRKFYMGK
jgi:3-methyladenine DNA glycosylase AlkD